MRVTGILIASLATALSTGCLFVSNPPDPVETGPGDISFSWSFDGESRCSRADVTEIDVQIFGPAETLVFSETIDCIGGGVTLRDFAPGQHEILLDAFDRFGDLAYLADPIVVTVRAGVDNDLGLVEFLPPGGPVVQDGAIASFWSFKYPTDQSLVIDCAVAGASEVLVEIVPVDPAQPVYNEIFDCAAEGFVVEGMAPGAYDISFLALGTYNNQDLPLYSSEILRIEVAPGALTDLGDLALDRIFDSFADIEVSWEFGAGDCASRGVIDLEVTIIRTSGNLEDDVFVAPCDTLLSVRRTFVPGGYVVTARGLGAGNVEYVGTRTLDVAPNATGSADLSLIIAE